MKAKACLHASLGIKSRIKKVEWQHHSTTSPEHFKITHYLMIKVYENLYDYFIKHLCLMSE